MFPHLSDILYAFANVDPSTGEISLSDSYADTQARFYSSSSAGMLSLTEYLSFPETLPYRLVERRREQPLREP